MLKGIIYVRGSNIRYKLFFVKNLKILKSTLSKTILFKQNIFKIKVSLYFCCVVAE